MASQLNSTKYFFPEKLAQFLHKLFQNISQIMTWCQHYTDVKIRKYKKKIKEVKLLNKYFSK
jgi:hypothetical protein